LVERHVANVTVVGSSPITRSFFAIFEVLQVNTELDNGPSAGETTAQEEPKKLSMQVEVEETGACERHVRVTIPRDDIEGYFQKQFDELLPKAEVPGFRVGKAPRKLVESKFRSQVKEQVKGSLLMDSLAQINDRDDFAPIGEPEFDYEKVEVPDDGPMIYEFDIEVRPDFEVPQWRGLKLERIEHEFSEQEINDAIQRFLGSFTTLTPVDEPAQLGDYVVCDVRCKHEGVVVSEADEVSIVIRKTVSFADGQLEDFDKLMVGVQAEETRTAEMTISQFADNEKLRGKQVELEFEVLDIKRLEIEEISDITERLGFESIGDFKDVIKRRMESQLAYERRQSIRKQITDSLTESAKWELPPDLLKRQSRRELERAVIEMRSSGFSEEEIRNRENRIRHNVLAQTEKMLKEHFILEKIAEDQSIEDTPQDYEAEIQRIAVQKNDSPRRVRARLDRTGEIDAMRNMIIEQKVIDLITSEATFTTIPYERDDQEQTTTALSLHVAGKAGTSNIPEAKYQDSTPTEVSTKPE
jgi:trigger factor